MIISKGIQIQKLSQVEASMWNCLSDQALSCLILYLISLAMDSPIQSYSNVMKEFLLEIMHILLPSSAPVPAMLGWDSISFNFYPPPPPPPPGNVPWRTFQVCGTILDCWQVAQYHLTMQHLSMQHLSMQHLSVQHLSMQHLSVQNFSIQHLSRDKIWLFTSATTPVWTKQSNFKLATKPSQNLANSS